MKKAISVTIMITGVILVVAALAVLFIGPQNVMGRMMGVMNPPPDALDTAETRLTEQGLFQVTYRSSNTPIPINQMHSWTVHVETADGQAVDQAVITVDGGMPQHGHGLPTQPQVTDNLGGGDYLLEGMRFQMPGFWEVKLDISANGQRDSITFNLVLK
jgi:hypothetical protein